MWFYVNPAKLGFELDRFTQSDKHCKIRSELRAEEASMSRHVMYKSRKNVDLTFTWVFIGCYPTCKTPMAPPSLHIWCYMWWICYRCWDPKSRQTDNQQSYHEAPMWNLNECQRAMQLFNWTQARTDTDIFISNETRWDCCMVPKELLKYTSKSGLPGR